MRLTSVLRQHAAKSSYKSLALTVTFKHPDFKMDDYEILCRGSAFLLSVDPPLLQDQGSKFAHLESEEWRRKMKAFKREKGYTPANPGGDMKDMGWLEFVPREYRPNVHIVASSHVMSPFLWKDYYPQDWLNHVRKDHCRYSLDVFDAPGNSIGSFPLEAEPFHHPEGRDVALAHFSDEPETLPKLRKLGVEVLHLRNDDDLYEKGESMVFDGYAVTGDDRLKKQDGDEEKKQDDDDDTRVFFPYKDTGTLSFHTNDRFFANTPNPLPEGLCGAPAVDAKGRCCGVVEGIVPLDSEHKKLAGHAAFMPHFIMNPFIQLVERQMTRAIMDEDLFQMVVTAKKTNTIGGGVFKMKGDGTYSTDATWEDANRSMIEQLKKQCSKEEFDAMMAVMADEKAEVERILKEEGGDLGEITKRVRAKTMAIRQMVHDQYRRAQERKDNNSQNQ
ncbi:hypothetical protein ACA910_000715 [Epithemia clementina (nom. ined.)]